MTNLEIWKYFNLTFNNVTSNLGAGITRAEATEFINRAIDAFVDNMYSSYEKSEYSRKALVELVKQEVVTDTVKDAYHVVPESKLYNLTDKPLDNLMYIVYESITMKGEIGCMSKKTIIVSPVTHDEFNHIYNDPFKFNERRALRLDVCDKGGKRCSEIVCKDNYSDDDKNKIESYLVRYIKAPSHIDLTKSNNDTKVECDINERFHKDIVESAAKLCAAYYKS